MNSKNKVAHTHSGSPCPVCKVGELQRTKRKGFVRWIPRSKSYECPKCRGKFLSVLELCTFRIRKAPQKKELAIISVAIITTVYLSIKLAVKLYAE